MLQEIIEAYEDCEILKADGFDDAVIGIATDFTEPRLIYSVKKCLEILGKDFKDEGEDSYEMAMEYFTFNVCGAWVGEQTPIWGWDDFL
jgi:hypothetical protein